MGDLIVMTHPPRQVRRETRHAESAEILFFTGVRYYRMPDHPLVEERINQSPRRRSAKALKAAEARRLKRQA